MILSLCFLAVISYLPDPTLTPGDANPKLTDAVLRAPGFHTGPYRHVPLGEKRAVFKAYGIPWSTHAKYEVDHFWSLEVGGSNDIKNLWPEPYHLNVQGKDLGARTKDKIEDKLGALVRSGKMTGADARLLIAHDWTIAYIKFCGPLPDFHS